MKLPKNYFENLSTTKYREYLKLLPEIKSDKMQHFVTLTLTFASLSFFGLFAINPTLSTVADLKKQIVDNQAIDDQLTTKIEHLSSLQEQYNQLSPSLFHIYDAIPRNADTPLLSAQIAMVLKKHNLTVSTYRIAEVQLANNKPGTKTQSYVFTLQAKGDYRDMMSFAEELSLVSRVITVESMGIERDNKTNNLMLILRGRVYFKQ
jgi:Tfp pilus assembly protein PilO